MSRTRKFIESHWLVFAFQGLISLLFGGFVLFTGIKDLRAFATIIGGTLLVLGVIEIFSLFCRKHFGGSLIISLIMVAAEIIIAALLLFFNQKDMTWQLMLVAIYTILRGVLAIIAAFTSMTDKTDRFMWTVCGICGAVIGIVILNAGGFFDKTAFIKFFGTYMMVYGITNLIYGVHNRNELKEEAHKRKATK